MMTIGRLGKFLSGAALNPTIALTSILLMNACKRQKCSYNIISAILLTARWIYEKCMSFNHMHSLYNHCFMYHTHSLWIAQKHLTYLQYFCTVSYSFNSLPPCLYNSSCLLVPHTVCFHTQYMAFEISFALSCLVLAASPQAYLAVFPSSFPPPLLYCEAPYWNIRHDVGRLY